MRPVDVTLLSLLHEELGFSQKLGQVAGDGERSCYPGLGDQDSGKPGKFSGQRKGGSCLGKWRSGRRAVSPRSDGNDGDHLMFYLVSTYYVPDT